MAVVNNDDRVKKLIERTNDPLPVYPSDLPSKVQRISFEGSHSEGQERGNTEGISDKRSQKKGMDMESNKKNGTGGKKEELNNQLTLDAFNFTSKPVIYGKKLKRNLVSIGDTILESDSVSNSSHDNQKYERFENQKTKMDRFLVQEGNKELAPIQERSENFVINQYPQFILNEKNEFLEKIEKLSAKTRELSRLVENKSFENTSLRKVLDDKEKELAYFKEKRKVLINLILELEAYRRRERVENVNNKKQRIGEYLQDKDPDTGSRHRNIWREGWESLKIIQRLDEIGNEKAKLDRVKKEVKSNKKISKRSIESELFEELIDVYGEDINSSQLNTEDMRETTKRIENVLLTLNKEEQYLREGKEALDKERVSLLQEDRLLKEELK
jgi:hypothetical protein